MIQVIVGIIVAVWSYWAAGTANLHRGKWVFIGLVSYLIASVLWAAIFVALLRKPVLEFLWQFNSDTIFFAGGIAIGAVYPAIGFITSYMIKRKYLTKDNRETALVLENTFAAKALYLFVALLLSIFVLYLAAEYAPALNLEPRFKHTLF